MSNFAGVSGNQLRSFLERIEFLEEQKSNISADTREVFAEAKSAGFDAKIMRRIIKLRKMNAAEQQEQEELLQIYLQALEMSLKMKAEKDAEEEAKAA
jgi:uncharacterized protein (UPF0335 family)